MGVLISKLCDSNHSHVHYCIPSPLPTAMCAPFLHPSCFLLYLSSKLISILLESVRFADFSETALSSYGVVCRKLSESPEGIGTLRNDRDPGKAIPTGVF